VPSYFARPDDGGARGGKAFFEPDFHFAARLPACAACARLRFTPFFVELIAPGFQADPDKFALAVRMTRITFPYLLFITLVTLHSGTLNAHGRFAVAAFAPVLLNLAIIDS